MDALEIKRKVYQESTEFNKRFFDILWKGETGPSLNVSFWWLTTVAELVVFYLVSFKNPGEWLYNIFIFWLWFYNGFLVTGALGLMILSGKIDYITTDMAKKIYAPGFEERAIEKFTLNTFLCILLTVAFIARGWTACAVLMCYSLIIGRLIKVINLRRLLTWNQVDFTWEGKDEEL